MIKQYSHKIKIAIKYDWILYIYTTKIDEFVCPPNISETVAVWIMELAHRPHVASTAIELILKPILLSFLSILLKTIQRIGAESADPKHKSLLPFVCLRWFGRLRSFRAAIWQINLYYIIFSTYQ